MPPTDVTARRATWDFPVPGYVGVELDGDLVNGTTPAFSAWFLRYALQTWAIHDVLHGGAILRVPYGAASPNPGSNLITYDGTGTPIPAVGGGVLLPFSLPVREPE